ncbi:MAG: hypothetical protein KGL39_39970 [Patescibacteria group bacterium]|nr:hypothetical protein [Patescibacteria group bacterium]
MKKYILMLPLLLGGCLGNTAVDNDLTGQVKKVQHITPILLPDYNRADISLGVLRNGVGSMSTEDVWLYVPSADDYKILQKAADTGALVKITYNVARFRFYVPEYYVTHVQIEQ